MENDLNRAVQEAFALPAADASGFSPLSLAFIGDAVYELIVRSLTVGTGSRHLNTMNREKASMVEAKAQAELIKILMDDLTDEEYTIYKRGRNAKSVSMPKNAKMSDYRMATGFETLVGWLYLSGQTGRLLALLKKGFSAAEELSCDTKN